MPEIPFTGCKHRLLLKRGVKGGSEMGRTAVAGVSLERA